MVVDLEVGGQLLAWFGKKIEESAIGTLFHRPATYSARLASCRQSVN